MLSTDEVRQLVDLITTRAPMSEIEQIYFRQLLNREGLEAAGRENAEIGRQLAGQLAESQAQPTEGNNGGVQTSEP